MPHDHPHHHHNHHTADHLHSHLTPEDAAADLQVLTAQFIDGFVAAKDKQAYLRLAGVPLERPGKTGPSALKLVDVKLTTEWQVGTASTPFPVRFRDRFLVYVSRRTRWISASYLTRRTFRNPRPGMRPCFTCTPMAARRCWSVLRWLPPSRSGRWPAARPLLG
jgi:hypothetical protein